MCDNRGVKLETMQCPRCGADVPVPPLGARSVRCEYCGNESRIVEPEGKKKLTPEEVAKIDIRVVPPTAPAPVPTRPPPKGSPVLVVLVLVVLVGAVAGAAVLLKSTVPGLPGGDDFQWRETPVVANVDGDGVEDFVGTYATRGDDYPIYLAAFSGATQKQLWRYGPLGKNSSELRYAAAGSTIVLTDITPKLHLLDATTGKEKSSLLLSDRTDEICTTVGANTIWIRTVDDKQTSIDLTTGAASPAPRPETCPKPAFDCDFHGIARCTEDSVAPAVEGFDPDYVLFEGTDAVALGSKSPGTAIPMAVGFDLKTKTVRWKKNLVPNPPSQWDSRLHAAGLEQGRLVASYQQADGKAEHLTALDAKTGAPQWDVEVPHSDVSSGDAMTVSPNRVYFPHWTYLDVFDAKTGAHIATLGAW